MILLYLIFISVVYSFQLADLRCSLKHINSNYLRVCNVEYGKHYYFHDFTGENQILVLGDKKLKNHNKVIGQIKDFTLYISEEELSDKQWENVFKNN